MQRDITRNQGSSPRVRGTQGRSRPRTPAGGIIPACAGNTAMIAISPPEIWDHPRVCGEHPALFCAMFCTLGSSPRVRGTRDDAVVVLGHDGIIPACAGNTSAYRLVSSATWDHPRVCGEHLHDQWIAEKKPGSSPRVRGTRRVRILIGLRTGIIPACAGNTRGHSCRFLYMWDHPRVCGEHSTVPTTYKA